MDTRFVCLQALGEFGTNAESAVPVIVHALADDSIAVRFEAARALLLIKPRSSDAVAALTRALKTEETMVAQIAAQALGEIGPITLDTLSALASASTSANYFGIGFYAAVSLSKIAGYAVLRIPMGDQVGRRAVDAQLASVEALLRNRNLVDGETKLTTDSAIQRIVQARATLNHR